MFTGIKKGVGGTLRSQDVAGVMIGIVTNIVHDSGDYRVKVRFPTLPNGGADGEDSNWCRIVSYMAGKDRGMFWLPEVEDEVLVCFFNGDFNQGVVLGAFWNGQDKPIYSNKDASGKVTDAGFQGKHEAKKNDLQRAALARRPSARVQRQRLGAARGAAHQAEAPHRARRQGQRADAD